MNVKNDISEELRSLSELVATISRQTPYRVADDYFTSLSSRILLRLKTQHKPMVFNVPEGYFDGFAEGLLARIKAGAGSAGKPAGASVAGAGAPSPYAGATGQPMAESAAAELAALSPLLAQLRSLETYRMPEGYFEEISPVLAVAKNFNPYTVPDEYFHQFPVSLTEEVVEEKLLEPQKEKTAAKVVSFGGRRANWFKYSAAAVVAGLILTIGWLRLHVPGGNGQKPVADLSHKLMNVTDQDLQSFLADQETPLTQQGNTASLDFNDNDVKSLIGDVPDGDLKQYMDEHGGAVDLATN